jgi:cysteine-rich repeat protein
MVKEKNNIILALFFVFALFLIGFTSACYCGDNSINTNGEECDKGTLNGVVCIAEYGTSCTWCTTSCKQSIVKNFCGDLETQINEGEECDDGNNINGDGCSSLCKKEIIPPTPLCGNSKIETGEECDKGLQNGDLCWAEYGSSCNYCTSACKIKIITNYCGDGIKQECEECDDGNTNNTDSCSNLCKINYPIPPQPFCGDAVCNNGETCSSCSSDCGICPPEPTCDHNISIRYNYVDTFNTGIGISENNVWLENPIVLTKDKTHIIRYRIENNKETKDNVSITVKVDNNIITQYTKEIASYHYNNSVNLYLSSLECDTYHTISLNITSDGKECDKSDNYASRQIYVKCSIEPPQPFCGDAICNNGETCSTCSSDCGVCPSSCDLTNAHWNTSSTYSGNIVSLIVDGLNCNGKTINFQIYQNKAGGDLYVVNTLAATFSSSNSVNSNWVAIAPLNGDTNPTYYFIAKVFDSSENAKSGNLSVNILYPPTPVCGNNIMESGEECDDGNNANKDGCSSICKKEKKDDNCNNDRCCEETINLQSCNTNWLCSGWSECSDGYMTRTCVDDNHCDVEYNKPYEKTSCSESIISKSLAEENTNSFWFVLGIIIFVVLLIILVNLL